MQPKLVVVGQSVPLTGPGSARTVPFSQGAKLYFERSTRRAASGGKIELVTIDDRGSPSLAVTDTRRLLGQGAVSLFAYYGSPQVVAVYPMIKDGGVVPFAPMAAAEELRGALYGNIYSPATGLFGGGGSHCTPRRNAGYAQIGHPPRRRQRVDVGPGLGREDHDERGGKSRAQGARHKWQRR